MSIVVWPPRLRPPLDYVIPPEWLQKIREAAREVEVVAPSGEAEAKAAAVTAQGWIGELTPALLAAAPRLRWLQVWNLGIEVHLFPELIASDVTMTVIRQISDDHIANHVLAVFLSWCRDLPRLMRAQVKGNWVSDVRARDPGEMTVLVLGMGAVGSQVARRLKAIGATVIGLDPKVTAAPQGVDELALPERLPDLLGRADAVVVCAPQTPRTLGLFDDAMFGKMKPDSFFINVGRGKIVRLDSLERALVERRIAGAALDVFETEPLPSDSALWKMENVIITPHSAAAAPHFRFERRLATVLENVRRFVDGKPLINVADKAEGY